MNRRRWLPVLLSLSVLSTAQTLRPRLNVTGGGGGSQTLTPTDFTWLGDLRIPGGEGQPADTSYPIQYMTGRRVGGVNHLFLTQNGNSGVYVGKWSPVELADPGGYNQDYTIAPFMTVVTNWGYANGSFGTSPYDTYGGMYGKTYDSGGTLINVGNAVSQFEIYPNGMGWHDVTSTCCLYVSYSLPYGAYQSTWALLAIDLTNPGSGPNQTGLSTTVNGPLRLCTGVFPLGGSQVCGPVRSNFFTDMPDGSMGVGAGNSYTQQGDPLNQGPSLWSGASWPSLSTPQGFGSTRGSAAYRTTDIVPSVDLLSYYTIAGSIAPDGTMLGGNPIVAVRRPPHVGGDFTNYYFEGGTCQSYGNAQNCTQAAIDPDQYSGIGAWTDSDGQGGMAWIDGTKNGFVAAATVSVGHGWYKTLSAQQVSPSGTGTTIIYQRAATEAWSAVPVPNAAHNDEVRFDVTSGNYSSALANRITLKYQNDGASQSRSCTVSGKAITVHLDTNGGGTITSTASNVVSIVNSTGACSTLVTASLYHGPGNDVPNDGSGTVGLITQDYAGQTVPSGILILNQGPQNCPIHNVDSGVTVTGPNTTRLEQELMIYRQSDLGQTPDYAPSPNEVMWFHDQWPTMHFQTYPGSMGGVYWDPVDRKLYVMANAADNATIPGFAKPIIHVFQVAGTAAPEPVSFWTWLTSFAPSFFKALPHSTPFVERPR